MMCDSFIADDERLVVRGCAVPFKCSSFPVAAAGCSMYFRIQASCAASMRGSFTASMQNSSAVVARCDGLRGRRHFTCSIYIYGLSTALQKAAHQVNDLQ